MTATPDPTPRPPEDATPIELEPVAPDPVRPPVPSPGSAAHARIEKEGVLSGFEKDADFDHDPQVQRALGKKIPKAKPSSARPTPEDDDADESTGPFVTPGLGNAKVWSVVAGVLLVSAVIAAGMTTTNRFASAFLTLYSGILHTGTGLIAVYFSARIDGRKLGDLELAAARMATAVSAFLLLFNLNINLAGTTKWEELILATLAYCGAVAGLFRLWGRPLGLVLTSHFALWIVFQIGMQLSAWASAAPAVSGTPR
ncbi:MAG TPA: hypothetical protein VK176_00385 [Phycisphaerales bacterium]|nr:hypothetical protein [Phycisphaerales bacterium]